jgi:3-isopropylmalate dehydratase small subunit
VVLPAERVTALRAMLEQSPGSHVGVDLDAQKVTKPDGTVDRFEITTLRTIAAGLNERGIPAATAMASGRRCKSDATLHGWPVSQSPPIARRQG